MSLYSYDICHIYVSHCYLSFKLLIDSFLDTADSDQAAVHLWSLHLMGPSVNTSQTEISGELKAGLSSVA